MFTPVIGTLLIGSICVWFLVILIRFFDRLWRTPRRIQKMMARQGIKGPPYRFLHGNTKEIERMRNQAMATPSELSHHTFPRVYPHFYSWIRLYGANFLTWVGPKPQLVVTDVELAKVILNNKDGVFEKAEMEGYLKKMLGDGLVLARGEKWQKQRKLANHAFNKENLNGMAEEMVASVEMLLERWRDRVGEEIEVFQEFKLLTSEVLSRTAFGSSFMEGERIFEMLTKMLHLIVRTNYRVKIPIIGKFLTTRDDVEAERLQQGIRDSIVEIIRKREERARSGETNDYGSDFLGSLVRAYHSDDEAKKISIDDLIDECKTFYSVGQETTMILLGWTMLLLALHTDWQDKAREQVLQLFGQNNPNPDGLAELTTMTMIVFESLRLYSPVLELPRKTTREVKLGGIVVPANMEVNVLTIALHQNPEIWGEDAHMFKPERFAEGVAKPTNNKISAYIPFGLGARACVGLGFSVNETKIALSMILQRYRFTLSPNYVHAPSRFASINPQHGVQIVLRPL